MRFQNGGNREVSASSIACEVSQNEPYPTPFSGFEKGDEKVPSLF